MLRMIFWMRVGLIGGLILVVGPWLAIGPGRLLLGNLFVIQGFGRMALVSSLAVFAAWTCGLSLNLVWRYAPSRMLSGPELGGLKPENAQLRLAVCSLPALSIIIVALGRSSPGFMDLLGAAAGFLGTTMVGVGLARRLWDKAHARENASTVSPLAAKMGKQGPWLSAGYVRRTDAGGYIFLPGHLVAIGLLTVLLSMYALLGLIYQPALFRVTQPPALVYVLILFMMTVTILAGISFFLDRFRVPLLLMVVGWNAISLSVNPPYTFLVYPVGMPRAGAAGKPAPAAESTPFIQLPPAAAPLAQRPRSGPLYNTVVVVCASGGGIQSAAWTTRVLTWLQEDVGEEFTHATRFYSGASGGSVGLMYFLDACHGTGAPSPAELPFIRESADKSSLSNLAWGLAYPDFTRVWFPGFGFRDRSRAWALELAWRRHPSSGGPASLDARWSDWAVAAGQGAGFPGVVFNVFEITQGYRVLLNNVQIPGASGAKPITALRRTEAPSDADPGRMDLDLDVVTAARMSASFPYVTPITTPAFDRARMKETGTPIPTDVKLADWAVADGGYFDNAGVMTAVEWVRAVAGDAIKDKVERIVFLEIRAFHRDVGGETSSLMRNWRFSALGPILGMLKTRESSQIARDDLDLVMLPAELAGRVEIVHLIAEPVEGEYPLSWQLSPSDLARLDSSRNNLPAYSGRKSSYPDIRRRLLNMKETKGSTPPK